MKAVVYNRPRDVSVNVPDPKIEAPTDILVRITKGPDAYKHFDARENGWTKVVLKPAA